MASSGTSIPALRAASKPTSTAPLTEGSASVEVGAHRPPDVGAVQAKIGIFPGSEECHQAQAGDSGSLLASGPVAPLGLRLHQILQALVVHLTHIARHGFPDPRVGRLGVRNGQATE